MLARNHTIEASRQDHDSRNRFVRGLQHVVVVRVDRYVGVHIAVTGVHVQGNPHAAFKDTFVNGHTLVQNRLEGSAREDGLKARLDLRFPTGTQGVVLQLWK